MEQQFIPAHLKSTVYFSHEEHCFARFDDKPLTKKTKGLELFSIIQWITGRAMTPSDWDYFRPPRIFSNDQTCICSQHDCREIHYKRHIPTGFVFKIGSSCALRFHDKEEDRKAEEIIVNQMVREVKKDDCSLPECDNKVMDKRKAHCKRGFCSTECEKASKKPLCYCRKRSCEKTAKTEANKGKKFFHCPYSNWPQDKGCGFFKWFK